MVHPLVFAFVGQREHIPLIIVGNANDTVEIEKGNPPTLGQRDSKRRILFIEKLQPEPTTVVIDFNVGRTAKAFPHSAYITDRERGIRLRCRTWLTLFSFHGTIPRTPAVCFRQSV